MDKAARVACFLVFAMALGVRGFGESGRPGEVRVVSSFAPAGAAAPEECGREAAVLVEALSTLPRVLGWHWVIVCDEAGWRRFARVSGQLNGGELYASTDLDGATTFVRGAKLLHPGDFHAGAQQVIAHEVAHVLLGSGDEEEAARLSLHWLGGGRTEAARVPEDGNFPGKGGR